ncbi:MAG TPA: hypothetical protein VN426_15410 [Syntrophomonadaceae bacterium]|nr:hypothetical protein [Syntrophomonadaceae bacterium]
MFSAVKTPPPDIEIQAHLTALHIEEWLRDDVFHFKWWVLLCLIVVALLIWWNRLDKSRLPETCLYAALTTIIVLGIFEWGEELILWDFPTDVIPIFPPLSSVNLISLPLIYSLTYQYFKTWKRFILASLMITAVICFIMEPILAWAGFYELIKWKYYYSFPIYAGMAIGIRALVNMIITVNSQNKK